MQTKAALFQDNAGWFVEWYRDDDDASGYGDNPEICRWYGTCAECRDRMKAAPPKDGWQPVGSDTSNDRYHAFLAENARI